MIIMYMITYFIFSLLASLKSIKCYQELTVKFEFLIVMKITVIFWDVILCNLPVFWKNLQHPALGFDLVVKIEAASSSRTSVPIVKLAWCHNPEECNCKSLPY